jgi:hypothetical protein
MRVLCAAAANGRVGAHIEGMRKARITKTTEAHPSYEVWVEQDGRSHLFAIAGSLEDAEEEAREAEREYGLRPIREDKCPPKRPRDPNQLAKSIIDIATGQKPDRDPTPEEQGPDFSVNQAISFWGHFSN